MFVLIYFRNPVGIEVRIIPMVKNQIRDRVFNIIGRENNQLVEYRIFNHNKYPVRFDGYVHKCKSRTVGVAVNDEQQLNNGGPPFIFLRPRGKY